MQEPNTRRDSLILTLNQPDLRDVLPKSPGFKEKVRIHRRCSTLLEKNSWQQYFTPIGTKSINQEVDDNVPFIDNIDWADLTIQGHLADGAMCRVYSAVYNGTECVVKTPLPEEFRYEGQGYDEIEKHLEDELEVLRMVNHPNCIRCYGTGRMEDGSRFIVLEKLQKMLIDAIGSRYQGKYNSGSKPMKYNTIDAVKWALELAQVLAYFNDTAVPFSIILHRDLKTENVGFGYDGRVKLLDLGLSKVVNRRFRSQSSHFQMSGGIGSLRYMAPEVVNCKPYNEKADVYSFAMVFWETLSRKEPYGKMDYDEFMTNAIEKGNRPALNRKWPFAIQKLLDLCWAAEMDERPAFREIVGHLEGVLVDEIHRIQLEAQAPPMSFSQKLRSAFGCMSIASKAISDPMENSKTKVRPQWTEEEKLEERRRNSGQDT
mmetsp:Transcript_1353/g.1823  ORF Transcript_1353/g.1823 Transcript_1353/m.1823 type:complete len:430 (+) Transcript_1353:348-1637(+)|eukprot:CAMPEP_0117755632 /NCGR_PEP_ID=MMETSP0947-20121206/13565_1 /TAXON_ID=44440 /ORGANISM="Chattonella subsalsa, Strain CCMP2191" /LENGTH=429 /DNA_ID=CAMNT_0005574999 /DNA_START=257 /DNA_END=1546 /DNA_ORIENTATION=+